MSHFLAPERLGMEPYFESIPCTTCRGDMRKCRGVGCNGMIGSGWRKKEVIEAPKMIAVQRDPQRPAALTFFFTREPTEQEVRDLVARVQVAKESLPPNGGFW